MGSICSGMGSDYWATQTEHLNARSFTHAFWCEIDVNCQRFLKANVDAQTTYSDVTSPTFLSSAPGVDILTAGCPCQPFSSMGQNLGESDIRGQVVSHIIQYVRIRRPAIVLLENVKGLLVKHGQLLEKEPS